MRSIFAWLAFVLLTSCSVGAQRPGSTHAVYLNTLAWNRYISCNLVHGVVDAQGNSCVLAEQSDPVFGTVNVYFSKYDPSGNALVFNKPVLALPAFISTICISPVVNGQQFIYADTESLVVDHAFKIDTAGTLVWHAQYGDSNHRYFNVAVGADAAGNGYIATQNFTAGQMEMYEYDANGHLLHGVSTNKIRALHGHFVQNRWFFDGFPGALSSGNVRWGYYDPASGNELAAAEYDVVDNGTTQYYYDATDYVDNQGAVYWGVTVTNAKDSTGAILAQSHFVKCYTINGGAAWTSKSLPSPLGSLAGPGSGGPLWAIVYPSGGPIFQQYDLQGNVSSPVNPVPNGSIIWPLLCDATGAYVLLTDTDQAKLTVDRADLTGYVQYSNTFAPLGGDIPQSQFANAYLANGILYTFSLASSGTNQAVVQRYVSGVTLSSVTGSSTVSGGSTLTVKVQLNAAAPSGGTTVKLTSSNAHLTFPNNTTTYSVAVPAGSEFVNVPMTASAVTTNTAVAIVGNQNGVVRQCSTTINP